MTRLLLLACTTMVIAGASGDPWRSPHPLRREALIAGRDFNLDPEDLLQRFSYSHLSDRPAPGEDGFRGTAGSLTSKVLYHETTVQKHLVADNGDHALLFRLRRYEDFDGHFDRQLVGYQYRTASRKWALALVGNATGDKARSDVQLEANWQPRQGHHLQTVLALPEFLFNSKETSAEAGRYRTNPRTLFVRYRFETSSSLAGDLAFNISPDAEFEDPTRNVVAKGNQTRLLALIRKEVRAGLQASGRIELEATDRHFTFSTGAVTDRRFERDWLAVTVRTDLTSRPRTPHFGFRYVRLDENGWFGNASKAVGRVRRHEYGGFAGFVWQTGERSWWEPGVIIMYGDIRQEFESGDFRDWVANDWYGKLVMPWRYRMNGANGGTITLNLSMYLHEAAFGGGNIQIHWPF